MSRGNSVAPCRSLLASSSRSVYTVAKLCALIPRTGRPRYQPSGGATLQVFGCHLFMIEGRSDHFKGMIAKVGRYGFRVLTAFYDEHRNVAIPRRKFCDGLAPFKNQYAREFMLARKLHD